MNNGLAAFGTLTWLGPSKVQDGPPTSWILQPGTSYPDQITRGPVIDLKSSLCEGIIDISLSTSGTTVKLTEMVEHLRIMIKSLEFAVTEYSDGKDFFSSDLIMDFALVPLDGSIPGQGVKEQE